jgi:hypothetical protein
MKITRILFCPTCFEAKRPHKYSWYMEMNDTKSTFCEAQHTTDTHDYGFSPHLVQLKEVIGNTVYQETLCLMDGCGIEILKDDNGDKQYFSIHDKKVFLLDGEYHFYDRHNILCKIIKSDLMHFKARVKVKPEEHTCPLNEWTALVDLFETPKI